MLCRCRWCTWFADRVLPLAMWHCRTLLMSCGWSLEVGPCARPTSGRLPSEFVPLVQRQLLRNRQLLRSHHTLHVRPGDHKVTAGFRTTNKRNFSPWRRALTGCITSIHHPGRPARKMQLASLPHGCTARDGAGATTHTHPPCTAACLLCFLVARRLAAHETWLAMVGKTKSGG